MSLHTKSQTNSFETIKPKMQISPNVLAQEHEQVHKKSE